MDATTIVCIIIPVVLIVLIFVGIGRRGQEVDRARAAYQESLSALKARPSSADLRQRTLDLGRQYSNLTRNRRGVTVYDEMALMNDINAATAGATASAAARAVRRLAYRARWASRRCDEDVTRSMTNC